MGTEGKVRLCSLVPGDHGHALKRCLSVRKRCSLRAVEHTLSRKALESSSLGLFKGYLDTVLEKQLGVALLEQGSWTSRDPCQPKPSCDLYLPEALLQVPCSQLKVTRVARICIIYSFIDKKTL